jgi:hypothetical protein
LGVSALPRSDQAENVADNQGSICHAEQFEKDGVRITNRESNWFTEQAAITQKMNGPKEQRKPPQDSGYSYLQDQNS